MDRQWDTIIRQWREAGAEVVPPPHVKAKVIARIDRGRNASPRLVWAGLAAIVVIVAFLALMDYRPVEQPIAVARSAPLREDPFAPPVPDPCYEPNTCLGVYEVLGSLQVQ